MKSVKKDINYYNHIIKKMPFLIILGLEIVSAAMSILYTATDWLKKIPESVVYVIFVVAACALVLLVWRMILFFMDSQ